MIILNNFLIKLSTDLKIILYLIFSLFFLRGFFQLYDGDTSWTLSFGSIIFSILGLFFLYKKYEMKYVSFSLIPLLLIFMISH
jgi:hypothetical protein